MNLSYTLLVTVFLCIGYVRTKKLPSYITLCHRSDPNLGACVRKAVEQIRPHMAEGIPELFIPPMNPLVLPEAGLDTGDNFKAAFKNIQIYYADEFKIDHLSMDLEKVHIDLAVSFPKLRIRSNYNVNGRILILQLEGEGPADGNFTDVSGKLTVDGNRIMKKGKQYITITNKKLDLNVGKPIFQFDNIFRDNQELNDQTNKVINENIVDIIDELRPVIDKTVTEFVFGVITRLFNKFSFDELFPK